jgi:hypothetical protein
MPIVDPSIYPVLSTYAVLAGGNQITANADTTISNGYWGTNQAGGSSSNLIDAGNPSGLNEVSVPTAVGELTDLITELTSRPVDVPAYTGETADATIYPGVYNSDSTIVFAPGITLTLDGENSPYDPVFIFIADSSITFTGPVTINLINGASAENVVWLARTAAVTFSAPIQSPTSGVLIANTTVTFAGAVNLDGRVFTKTADITFTGISSVTAPSNLPAPCFNKGTQILTEDGYKSVELLKVGDMIQTFGDIDKGTVTLRDSTFQKCVFIKKTNVSSPTKVNGLICFKAGSLGDNLPEQDLYVSPNHGMVVGDHLKAAQYLIDGTKVFQDLTKKYIDYFHIELETHSCLKANGVLTESFLR